ncbi:hypothetical protein RCL_jg11484.t1 [Rhizophagus clarus]|uniref:Gfd2/YDR514C-like C-terminal domain-containing protein n=1 Tax=Rhizophagus clarus TaxID=94130 RepID=A0A8H3LBE3_9GLOM|nr:hypothetical protein RCL_jg11484.t1 [Rhizophagus clarus]
MPEVQLYQYHFVVKQWKGIKNAKIEQFFNTSYFFAQHPTLEFFLGIESKNNEDYLVLLLSEDSVKSIHTELESITSSKLPMIKEIKKFNKKSKADNKLRKMKENWEKAQNMVKTKKYFFVAVDVESYERDHSCILEVGWSMFDSKSEKFMDRHFCATEYKHLKNGQFVPDRKDRFIFGDTVWESLKQIGNEITKDLTGENENGNVVLVGHDVQMDVKYLESMGVNVKEVIKPVEYFDTAEMNAARVGKPNQRINLGKLLDELEIENYCLHNAGNDAHYTLCLFLELCRLPLQSPEESSSD